MKIKNTQQKGITDIQKRILQYVSQGARNRKIASEMYISIDTVKSQMTNICKKLNAENRTHAIYIALKTNIID